MAPFVVGLLAGAIPAASYTLVLWRQRRLFLRTEVDAERSRSRIESVSIPAGWILGGLVAFSMATLSDAGRIPVETFLAGALLAFYPGLFANFLRLRREEWN